MKILRIILVGLAVALAIATEASAQTEAIDPASYAPAWTPGQRNVPFAFHRATGELITRSRISITTASTVTILAVTTDAAGTGFVAFPDSACVALDLVNTTTADVEYRRNGAGNTLVIPAGGSRLIIGITNANQISLRRVDVSGTQAVIKAEAIQP